MSNVDTLPKSTWRLPDLRVVHWLPRLALAAIILNQGVMKTPLAAGDAESLGIPFILLALAVVGEYCAGAALLIGGVMRNALGDLITRLGGFVLAFITISVLVVIYWAPLADLFLDNQLHLLMIVGGLYFAARGNSA